MKRFLTLALAFFAAAALVRKGVAEDAPGRVVGFDLGVKFTLPHDWMVLQEPDSAPAAGQGGNDPLLLFYARPDDPSFIPGAKWANEASLSVSRLPAGSDAASQTVALKEALTQEGYRVADTSSASQTEGGVQASSARLYCYSAGGPPIIVEVSRWEANGERIVAQLRYSEAVRADLKDDITAIKASFQRNGAATLAFGAGLANVAAAPSASAAPGASPSPATASAPSASPSDAAAAAASAGPSPEDNADIIHNLTGSLVFIEGDKGAGSGFICTLEKHKCLVTNIHVMSNNKNPKFTMLDGSPIQVGEGYAALDHDIFSFLVSSGGKPIEAMDAVDQNVAIGDDVLVPGNAEGARVVTATAGTVVGIGPNLVEVSAPFVVGNSGSPIIHKKSGKVIGVATYLVERITPSGDPNSAPQIKIRRFAYRLDTIKKWQPVYWPEFNDQGALMDNIELLTKDLETFSREIGRARLRPGVFKETAIEQPVADYVELTGRARMSEYDLVNARRDLLSAVRSASLSDVAQAKTKFTYDYFQRALEDQERVRNEYAKFFQTLSDLQTGRASSQPAPYAY